MNILKKENIVQKIIIALIFMILMNFTVPNYIYAAEVDFDDADVKDEADFFGADILKELVGLVASLGDIVLGGISHFMVGTKGVLSIMLDKQDPNVQTGYLKADLKDGKADKYLKGSNMDGLIFDDWKIPNIPYCPEYIFSNQIASLDANFVNPKEYTDAQGNKIESLATKFQTITRSWYVGFKNIATVGLMLVLVYIGIRILLSVSIINKAKYTQQLLDWLVAFCLLFLMHHIMAATLMLTDKVSELLTDSISEQITVAITVDNKDSNVSDKVDGKSVLAIKTNLMGYVRLRAQTSKLGSATLYTFIYLVLVTYTAIYTFMYVMRFIYMAVFTLIAPFVALKYPLDRLKGGSSKTLTWWFTGFLGYALQQPIHLIIYMTLISSALDLVTTNFIFAIVAVVAIIPIEKFIKNAFSSIGGEANGINGLALASTIPNMFKGLTQKSSQSSDSRGNGSTSESNKINEYKGENGHKDFDAWKDKEQTKIRTSSETGDSNSIYKPKADKYTEENDDIPKLENQYNDKDNDKEENTFNGYTEEEEHSNRIDTVGNMSGDTLGLQDDSDMSNNDDAVDIYDDEDLFKSEEYDNDSFGEENEEEEDNRTFSEWFKDETPLGHMATGIGNKIGDIKDGAIGLKNKAIDGVKNSEAGQWVGDRVNSIPKPIRNSLKGTAKTLGRGVKGGAKKLIAQRGTMVNAAARLAMGTTGAALSIPSALLKGDASEIVKGAKTGANLGSSMVNNTGKLVSNTIQAGRSVREAYEEEAYGEAQAKRMRTARNNESVKKQFMKDDNERAKARERSAKLEKANGRRYSTKEVMEAAWNYREAGITDDSNITAGLKLEAKYSGGELNNKEWQGKSINVMQEIERFSSPDYIIDEKKRTGYKKYLESAIGQENAQDFLKMYADGLGVGEVIEQQEKEKVAKEKVAKEKGAKEKEAKPQEKKRKARTAEENKKAREKASESPEEAARYLENLKNRNNSSNNDGDTNKIIM